jgi:hypothetical protein
MYLARAGYALSASVLAAALLSGCAGMEPRKVTSVVDPDRISAVQELAVWKQTADTLPSTAPAGCEPKYRAAQQQVTAWIEGPLTIEIDDVAAQYYGTVDLDKARIPPQISSAVATFQACAAETVSRGAPEDVAYGILKWAAAEAKGQRKESAEALKARLRGYEWADWASLKRSSSPR